MKAQMKPTKEQVLQEIKEILNKYDAEITIEKNGAQWQETYYICLSFNSVDFDYEEIDLGIAIIP